MDSYSAIVSDALTKLQTKLYINQNAQNMTNNDVNKSHKANECH